MRKSILKTKEYPYTVIYKPAGKSGYEVLVPMLPGIVTYGRDFDEARIMAQDAIKCHLNGLKKSNEPIPLEKFVLEEKLTVALSR